jgi:hypothetical protein
MKGNVFLNFVFTKILKIKSGFLGFFISNFWKNPNWTGRFLVSWQNQTGFFSFHKNRLNPCSSVPQFLSFWTSMLKLKKELLKDVLTTLFSKILICIKSLKYLTVKYWPFNAAVQGSSFFHLGEPQLTPLQQGRGHQVNKKCYHHNVLQANPITSSHYQSVSY